eukprot:9048695-Lingulodinium_polyedra.AAC.1
MESSHSVSGVMNSFPLSLSSAQRSRGFKMARNITVVRPPWATSHSPLSAPRIEAGKTAG